MLTPKEFEKGNEQKYNELLVSIEASEGIMSLLIAVCDDSYLRDQIIKRYEAEVQSYIHPYRLKLARGEPSLRYAIEQLVQKDEYLVNNARAVITVTEIEKLGFLKELEDISSEREIFFGYLQWTREGLREFLYPIVLWLTNEVLIKLSKHAPDFWSWRRGVFRFLPQKVQIEQGLYAKKPEQADYYARMGRIYLNQLKSGQFADYKTEQELAVGYFKETVALQRELGLDKELANSLNELATLYLDQGRYIEAESLLIEALELSYRPLTLPAVALTTLILRKAFEKTGEKLREKVLEECNKLLSLLRKKEPKTASAIELAQQQPLNYGQAYLVKQVEEAANKDPEIAQAVQALVNEAKSQLAIIGNWQEINIKGETNTISGNTINFWLQAPERERVKLNFHTIVPQNLPLSGAVGFFGHETELQTLYQMLQQNNQVAIAAIAGMGGVGKTELALQYAIAHREIYKGGICWLLPKTGDVGIQVVQFARTQLYLNPPEDFDLLAQVQYCWRRWREGEVLLVLDDVSDYEQVKPYLQSLPSRFKVLMTTRQNLGRIAQLSLDVLQPEAALELLRSLLKETPERIERELSVANQLCKWLGYLPLAVELVGRYLARKQDLSLAEMLRRLENKRLDERSLSKSKSEADMTAQRDVLAAFELSWQELEDDDKQLGCLLSLFAAAPIPWKLVEQCLPEEDAEDLEEIRYSLLNLHLLQRKGEGIYQLHPLLREFFQYKLTGLEQAEELKRSFCKVMVAVAKDIPDSPTLEQINDVTPATPHIVEVAKNLIQYVSDDDLIWAFLGNARFYNGQGLYDKAAPWFKQCLEITKKRLGEEHPDVALSLNNLALLYYSQGRYSEAEPLYIQALALWRKLLGEEHPDVALSLNNLALLYYSQGRYSEAEPLYIQALALWRKLLGEEHPDVALSLNNLALLYYSQGRYSEAEPLYIQALALWRKLLGEEHPSVASSLNNLALLYYSQGRYSEAEPLHIQALALRRKLLGEEHPSVASSLNNLALLYYSQGRYDEAEPLHIQALALTRKLLGEEHPDVALSLNNLANLYYSQGRYSEAEPLLLQALQLRRRLLGDEHPDVAQNLNDLANLYASQGRYSEAEPLLLQALQLRRRLLGDEHPDVAQNLNDLANLYASQGRYSKAEPLLLQALQLRRHLLGDEHPDVAQNLNDLAIVYIPQGRYAEAEPLLLQALQLRQRLLGEQHPDVATNFKNLAELYNSQGRYTEAEPLYIKALEIAERGLGVNHPNTITVRENLKSLRDRHV